MSATQSDLIRVLPADIRKEIKQRLRMGIFSSEKEVITSGLRKAFSEEARDYLRKLVRGQKITEKAMLKEWKKLRG